MILHLGRGSFLKNHLFSLVCPWLSIALQIRIVALNTIHSFIQITQSLILLLFVGLITLIRLQIHSPGLISDKASAWITDNIIRLGEVWGAYFIA